MKQVRQAMIGTAIWTVIWTAGLMAVWADERGMPEARADTPTLNYRLKWLFNTSVAGDVFAMEGGFLTTPAWKSGSGKAARKRCHQGAGTGICQLVWLRQTR